MIRTAEYLLALLALNFLLPSQTRAAESYDNCTGFIDSLPATISTQGTWCLRKDLSTAMTSGHAINIAANNVTIDCNNFKIGGLAAGDDSWATGIQTGNSQNATVRHCVIRGFMYGINFSGAGHLIEDNRLDQNLETGITVIGYNNRVRRNAVYDTGVAGAGSHGRASGIVASADVIDNTVAGVWTSGGGAIAVGIVMHGHGSEARGNQVRGLSAEATGVSYGIVAVHAGIRLADNHITAEVMTAGSGITEELGNTFCIGNTVLNFETAYDGCLYGRDNLPEISPP